MTDEDTKRGSRPAGSSSRRLRGAVARHLGIAILSGDHPPGSRLPNEVDLATMLGVSRGAVREASQVLTAKGLVEGRPKTGTHVLPRSRWNVLDPDVLAWAFLGTPDTGFIRHLFELRAMIEPGAAALAAERRDRHDLKAMRAALAVMARHTLATEEGRAADREFHAALLAATKNDAVMFLSSSIGAAVTWTTQFKQRSRSLPRDPVPDHRRVLDAIADGNTEDARAAMRILVDMALIDTELSLADGPVLPLPVFNAGEDEAGSPFKP